MARLSVLPDLTPAARPQGGEAEQLGIRCAFMRGGSSRGGFFLADDLPAVAAERFAVLLACYGSPDDRQIDGIGGADPLTSKAAVVGRSSRQDADVDYTFYQVGIDRPVVSSGGNCGNMLAAVGPFAILRGLVAAVEPETTVRIHTTNTGQVITARIPVIDGLPACEGDCRIAGVPDSGATIRLDFGDCAGAVSGKLLPTGAARDAITLDGCSAEVSLVDAATPFVFVRAADIGARGTELPEELRANALVMSRLEQVRGWAAVKLGLVARREDAEKASPNIPRVIMVAPPVTYAALTVGKVVEAEMDLCVRQLAMQRPHKALAVTGAVCTAVASAIPGSVVAECMTPPQGDVRLGHPSGVLRVSARIGRDNGKAFAIERAEIERTARLIMDGTVFVRRRKVTALAGEVS